MPENNQRKFLENQPPEFSDGQNMAGPASKGQGPTNDAGHAPSSRWVVNDSGRPSSPRTFTHLPYSNNQEEPRTSRLQNTLAIIIVMILVLAVMLVGFIGHGTYRRYHHDPKLAKELEEELTQPKPNTVRGQQKAFDDTRSSIELTLNGMITNKHVSQHDVVDLNELIAQADTNNARLARIKGMNADTVKLQFGRYSQAYATDKALLQDYNNHAVAISAMYKTCGADWNDVADEQDTSMHDQMMASCQAAIQPLSDSQDPAMKTLLASINSALAASDAAVKNLAPNNAPNGTEGTQKNQTSKKNSNKDVVPSKYVSDGIEQYSRDLSAERDATHVKWAFNRVCDTYHAQKDASDEGRHVRKAFLDGPAQYMDGKKVQFTAKVFENIAEQLSLLDSVMSAIVDDGEKSLEPSDVDDLNAVLNAASQADQQFEAQMKSDGLQREGDFKAYRSHYDKDKALVSRYASTMLAVSNADAACSSLPEQVPSDPNYTQYSNYVSSCSTAVQALKDFQDSKTNDLYTKMWGNVSYSSGIVGKMKDFGAPDEADNGPHSREYNELLSKFQDNTNSKSQKMFDDYNFSFYYGRFEDEALDAVHAMCGMADDD